MIALNDVTTSAEKQERAGTICTFSFTLFEAFIPYKSALLVSHQTTDSNPLKRTLGNGTIYFRG